MATTRPKCVCTHNAAVCQTAQARSTQALAFCVMKGGTEGQTLKHAQHEA